MATSMKLMSRSSGPTTSRIVKALGVFGSVQVLSVLASIVRVKMVAVLIGPLGVGIYSLLWQTMELMRNVGGLNAHTPAVKEIASLRSNPDSQEITVRSFRRVSAWLGLFTMALTAIAAPLLSRFMFGNGDYTLWFVLISPVVAFSIMSVSNNAVMQARERLRQLALSNLWACVTSSLCAVLFIWLWGLGGIIPALLSIGVLQYVFSWIFSERKMSVSSAWKTMASTFSDNKSLLSMGGYLTVSLGVTLLCSYLFIVYLNREFGPETVGLFQAGNTMLTAYAGTFFVAMTVEYYPRLSRKSSPLGVSAVVNHEIILILRILLPLVVLFVAVAWLLVRLLYTSEFEGVVPFLIFGAPGLLFKAVSTCLAYTILARGDGRTYIFTEVASSLIGLGLYIVGFRMYGFAGVGVAFTLWYAAYTLITFYVYRFRYSYVLRTSVWKILIYGLLAACAAIVAVSFFNNASLYGR